MNKTPLFGFLVALVLVVPFGVVHAGSSSGRRGDVMLAEICTNWCTVLFLETCALLEAVWEEHELVQDDDVILLWEEQEEHQHDEQEKGVVVPLWEEEEHDQQEFEEECAVALGNDHSEDCVSVCTTCINEKKGNSHHHHTHYQLVYDNPHNGNSNPDNNDMSPASCFCNLLEDVGIIDSQIVNFDQCINIIKERPRSAYY